MVIGRALMYGLSMSDILTMVYSRIVGDFDSLVTGVDLDVRIEYSDLVNPHLTSKSVFVD